MLHGAAWSHCSDRRTCVRHHLGEGLICPSGSALRWVMGSKCFAAVPQAARLALPGPAARWHTQIKRLEVVRKFGTCGFSLRRDFYKLEKVGRCHSEAKIFSLPFCSQVTKLSYSRLTPRWLRAEFGCRHILLALMWQPVSTQFAASLLTFILPRCCAGTAVGADDRLQKSLAFPTGLQKQISAARDKHLAAQPKKPQASRRQRGNAQ